MSLEAKNTSVMKNPYWHDVVYGPAKTGKTTFGGTFPSPLFMSLDEDGMLSLRKKNIDFVEPMSWLEIQSLMLSIREGADEGGFTYKGKRYESLIIDPLNRVYNLCLEGTGKMKAAGGGAPSIADYGLTNAKVMAFVREICRLPFHALFTCLERLDKCEYTGRVSAGLLLSPGVAKTIPAIVSHTFHSLAVPHGNGNINYLLATQQESYYPAGGRYEDKPLPLRVVPNFPKMYKAVQ